MDKAKKWYQSKTILSAIAVVAIGVYELVGAHLAPAVGFNLPPIPAWVLVILGGLGIYGRTAADKKIN